MRQILSLTSTTLLLLASCAPSEDNIAKESQVGDAYLELLNRPKQWEKTKPMLAARWSVAQVPMVLELHRLNRNRLLAFELDEFLGEQTGEKFDRDRHAWQTWLWSQDYEPLADYPAFKSKLYQLIDHKFEDYFGNDRKATIRLDEIVWGGVLQDGIPPLRNPRMIAASKANYLADGDIVFGIEVNGEARAYPKRILAWHEMFVDTIQGIPLAGVY